MKKLLVVVLLIILAPGCPVFAVDQAPEVRAKARADYPTPLCVVSGEHLEAGNIVEFVYKQDGKPDRLVRLCCHKCERRFKASPAKYLEKLDAAAKAGKKN
jgi:hypothetical protein